MRFYPESRFPNIESRFTHPLVPSEQMDGTVPLDEGDKDIGTSDIFKTYAIDDGRLAIEQGGMKAGDRRLETGDRRPETGGRRMQNNTLSSPQSFSGDPFFNVIGMEERRLTIAD
jgi:hypothetical protein